MLPRSTAPSGVKGVGTIGTIPSITKPDITLYSSHSLPFLVHGDQEAADKDEKAAGHQRDRQRFSQQNRRKQDTEDRQQIHRKSGLHHFNSLYDGEIKQHRQTQAEHGYEDEAPPHRGRQVTQLPPSAPVYRNVDQQQFEIGNNERPHQDLGR